MGVNVLPAPATGKTRYALTLTSGTSYTVPAGVTYLNVTLFGGGGGGAGAGGNTFEGHRSFPGQMIKSTLSATPGASITYAIGAGGTAGGVGAKGTVGGTTSFTGATSALGGNPAPSMGFSGTTGMDSPGYGNGGSWALGTGAGGSAGGAGSILVEYWV